MAALRDDAQQWWADQLACDPEDYGEGRRPYAADAEATSETKLPVPRACRRRQAHGDKRSGRGTAPPLAVVNQAIMPGGIVDSTAVDQIERRRLVDRPATAGA